MNFFCSLGDPYSQRPWIFLIGLTPSCITQKSKYYISVWIKTYISILNFKPFSCSLFNTCPNLTGWLSQSLVSNTNRSYIYDHVYSKPWNILLILFWKISGKFLTPIVICLYLHLTHFSIIVNILLAFYGILIG